MSSGGLCSESDAVIPPIDQSGRDTDLRGIGLPAGGGIVVGFLVSTYPVWRTSHFVVPSAAGVHVQSRFPFSGTVTSVRRTTVRKTAVSRRRTSKWLNASDHSIPATCALTMMYLGP